MMWCDKCKQWVSAGSIINKRNGETVIEFFCPKCLTTIELKMENKDQRGGNKEGL